MAYRKGQNFIVFVGTSADRVAYSRSCSIEIKVETIEVSDPSTGTWKNYIAGKGDWAVSVSGLVATTRNDVDLWAILKDRQPVDLYYQDMDGEQYWHGKAILTQLSQNAEIHQTTTYSAKFQGTGELENVKN